MRCLYRRASVAAALAIVVSFAIFLLWDRLPFCEYESTCELCYCQQGEDAGQCASECKQMNPMLVEELQTMREHWYSAAFRSGVCERVRSVDPSGRFDDCVQAALVDIGKSKGSVVVRTRAHDSTIATECAEAFADEIVLTQGKRMGSNRRQGLLQLEKNKQKQIRLVEKIKKGIENARTRSDHVMVRKLSSELAVQQQLLMGMSKEIDELTVKTEWGASFKKIDGTGKNTTVVQPTSMQILCFAVCAYFVMLSALTAFGRHSNAGGCDGFWYAKGEK